MAGTSPRCSASHRIDWEMRAPASSPRASFVASISLTGGSVTWRYWSATFRRRTGSSMTTQCHSWAFEALGAKHPISMHSSSSSRGTGRVRSSRRRTAFVVVSRWSISSRWAKAVIRAFRIRRFVPWIEHDNRT